MQSRSKALVDQRLSVSRRPLTSSVRGVLSVALVAFLSGCQGIQHSDQVSEPGPVQANELQSLNRDMEPVQIAFMPDIHFHDIYGDFRDGSFKGISNSKSGQKATIRTMHAQLTSTRLFNENYFALLAALDDVVKRGVKYVALPGDFSDDGQPVHVRGLEKILRRYADDYGLVFFAAPGNHDPVRPYNLPAGKSDYLGRDGKEQRIFSKGVNECRGYSQSWATVDAGHELATICTEEVVHQGYEGLVSTLSNYGFFPQKEYLYWETPYSTYDENHYDFKQALNQSSYEKRMYEICHEGTGGKYRKSSYTNCFMVPDTSYLVEPVKGLWLLAIDANVYIPKAIADTRNPQNPGNFDGSGNAGYNKMLTHKQQVIQWMKEVARRAEVEGKQLVAFSHFPMSEFYNGASDTLTELFGEGNFQLKRSPRDDVTRALAEAGIKVHVGGHMHFNDTGVHKYDDGKFLFNIQAPSMAAYVPAYKLMSIDAGDQIEVKTVVLDNVPRFDELFEHYQQEYLHLKAMESNKLWNPDILKSKNYREFTNWHIAELTRMRFLPKEWSEDLRNMLFQFTGKDILILSRLSNSVSLGQVKRAGFDLKRLKAESESFKHQWQKAEDEVQMLLASKNTSLKALDQWSGYDLAVDFYRLRNADQLALKDISQERLREYELIAHQLKNSPYLLTWKNNRISDNAPFMVLFQDRFGKIFGTLSAFLNGDPSDHFMLHIDSGEIRDLSSMT
ncbi:metallophosphoesterase [Endozoicomonas sp. Mp262]|uniref:metallophosphoesterase n=1 Tax=Endozoicomonas sp. Mp262 TaxID=2919499 RepID=UPI0021D84B35